MRKLAARRGHHYLTSVKFLSLIVLIASIGCEERTVVCLDEMQQHHVCSKTIPTLYRLVNGSVALGEVNKVKEMTVHIYPVAKKTDECWEVAVGKNLVTDSFDIKGRVVLEKDLWMGNTKYYHYSGDRPTGYDLYNKWGERSNAIYEWRGTDTCIRKVFSSSGNKPDTDTSIKVFFFNESEFMSGEKDIDSFRDETLRFYSQNMHISKQVRFYKDDQTELLFTVLKIDKFGNPTDIVFGKNNRFHMWRFEYKYYD